MGAREQAIEMRAGEILKSCEATLIALKSRREVVHTAMARLGEQYRKEMYGYRLVLYQKTRAGNKDTRALYWARFSSPPMEAFSPTGVKRIRFKKHLRGGLKRSKIYHLAEASRKERLMGYDECAEFLNVAHRRLTRAIQSATKKWTSRGERRRWECQDLDLQPPELSRDLDPQDEATMGGAWSYCVRMAATTVDLEIFCANYQAKPIHKDLTLVFASDLDHPHGRARWLYKGHPLVRLEGSGVQDRMTDSWLRSMQPWLRLAADERRHLTEVEKERRRLMKDLHRYAKPLGGFLKRSAEALLIAQSNLAAAEGRARDVA